MLQLLRALTEQLDILNGCIERAHSHLRRARALAEGLDDPELTRILKAAGCGGASETPPPEA